MELQLSTLYNKVFGIHARRYPKFDTDPEVLPYETPKDMKVYNDSNENELKSIFGTPLFMPLKIDDFWLPNEPIITVTGGKNIIKTVVAGLEGTVKEEINTNDYLIVIKGIITNDKTDDYPEEAVTTLRNLCEKPGSRNVANKLFKIFGIDEIAIESYNIFGIAGHQSEQAYQINALSDRPIELVIKEGL